MTTGVRTHNGFSPRFAPRRLATLPLTGGKSLSDLHSSVDRLELVRSDRMNLQQDVHINFPQAGHLHTDVLEERFGTITPRVVHHSEMYREAYLSDGNGVCRTFAVTLFPTAGPVADPAAVSREIRTGGAIGKTFRAHGFGVAKNILKVFLVDVPGWLRRAFADENPLAKARMTEFLARHEAGPTLVYGTVIEIYHPDFRPAEISAFDRLQESPSVAALVQHRVISHDAVWDYVMSAPHPADVQSPAYRDAVRTTRREIRSSRQMLADILKAAH